MRIFWPTNIERRVGTAVGWRLPPSIDRSDPVGAKATLVVVDVVDDDAVHALDPPLETLARVLSPSEHPVDGLTIWADGTPTAFSQPADTVLFTPAQDLVLPSEDGEMAEYGATVEPTDLRSLLERLNAVAAAQDRLRGRSPSPSMGLGRIAFFVPWLQFGAILVYSGILTPVSGTIFCVTMASAFLTCEAVMGPPRRIQLPQAVQRLAHLPPPIFSAFIHQLVHRVRTIGALVEAPLTQKTQVAHFAPAAAITPLLQQTDMLFGALASVLLLRYPHLPIPRDLADTLTVPIIAALQWLDDWPFGLKLNTGLSAFLCGSIARVLELWRDAATPVLARALPHVPIALALVSPLGASFGVALLSDLLALLTLHLRLIYYVTAALSRVSMTALLGLWDLFRGRRWNVLRHRTDSHAFEVDTLFLGTLLFTVTAFLAPTVLAYGLLFTLIYFGIFIAHRVLALAIAGINCSVLFQLASSLPHSRGIPYGIVFDVVPRTTCGRTADGAYPVQHALELKSTSMGVGGLLGRWWSDTMLTAR